MSKVLISGDWHGWKSAVAKACDVALVHGVHHIFQLGDMGLWPGPKGIKFLDDCQRLAEDHKLTIYALPGNHEDHIQWKHAFRPDPEPVRHAETGGVYVRSNVVLLPRATTFHWFGKTWAVAGGAVSIDRNMRVPFESWWPDEELEDWEADKLQSKVDILLTHDASNMTPWGFQLVPHFGSQLHRQRIDRVLQQTRPEVHFHGHMHHKYDWMNNVRGHYVQTYGLHCNGLPNSNGILDTKTLEFSFR